MPRDGDIGEPTREYPEFARRQATAAEAGSRVGAGERVDEFGTPGDSERSSDAPRRIVPDVSVSTAGRRLFWLAGIIGLAVVLLLGIQAAGLWPNWRNPFAQQETDRSQPPLLRSIQDLSRYVAAEGNYQVVIDLQKDRNNVPPLLLNERTLFVGAGTVEAYVDFAGISERAIVESPDRKSVEIKLPAPQLGEVNLDLANSYVFAEQRGLLNRLSDVFGGDPNRQREVYQLAEERIAAAARDSGLGERAQDNTRKMLEGLLRSLGYEKVTVSYAAS